MGLIVPQNNNHTAGASPTKDAAPKEALALRSTFVSAFGVDGLGLSYSAHPPHQPAYL